MGTVEKRLSKLVYRPGHHQLFPVKFIYFNKSFYMLFGVGKTNIYLLYLLHLTCRFTLEPMKITLEPSRLTLDLRDSFWSHGGCWHILAFQRLAQIYRRHLCAILINSKKVQENFCYSEF
jgi:hypothetical protein